MGVVTVILCAELCAGTYALVLMWYDVDLFIILYYFCQKMNM